MLSLKDIIKAVNNEIKIVFPKINISSEDIKEGFKRPSFFVNIENNMSNKFNEVTKEKKLTIRIYYFPSDRYKNRVELLEAQDKLENIFFEGLKVNDNTFIPLADDMEAIIVDGVLQLSLYLYVLEEIEDTDTSPLMDTLHIDNKVNLERVIF